MKPADTIVAVATAPGEAGIGVVRLSGPEALTLALKVFRSRETPMPRRVVYGAVYRPQTGEKLDTALLTTFRAPASYTGEEVVEISCHGSDLVLRTLVRDLAGLGARLADPGEFTKRAFLNGKLDLAEAEAVIDLIRARSEAALRVATGQLSGRLSREISEMRLALITLLAEIEAAIDFPDDVEPPDDAALCHRAGEVRDRGKTLLATADSGRLYRQGAALVLAGRPNVGKSSLLNALLGEHRAIVTPIPGTTRDVIEESLTLDGIPIRAIDTAGLRETDDPVEQQGVQRAKAQLQAADLILWVIDPTQAPAPQLPDASIDMSRTLIVVNKCDLIPAPNLRQERSVSALTGDGLPKLREAIAAKLREGRVAPESVWISSARHEERLRIALASLERAIEAAAEGFDQAAIALDLRLAAEALGQITGESVTEDTITQIFARFCVGK